MAALIRRALPLPRRTTRTFSTTPALPVDLQWSRNDPESLAEALPPYPYGPTRLYKQSAKGLYGGQRLQFGNNVSDKHEVKTRRQWHPNIQTKRLFSKALNRAVQVRVSSRVLRTIDKLGGVDEYLLGEKEGRIKALGESGWWLRWAIMQTQSVKNRFAAEREALGLPVRREDLAVEEEDAEATLAASTPDSEVAELASATDPDFESDPRDHGTEGVSGLLAEDDAFQVLDNANLPPLKFRVARGAHIVLTKDGWRRTRPYDLSKQKTRAAIRERVESRTERAHATAMRSVRSALQGQYRMTKGRVEVQPTLERAWERRQRAQAEAGEQLAEGTEAVEGTQTAEAKAAETTEAAQDTETVDGTGSAPPARKKTVPIRHDLQAEERAQLDKAAARFLEKRVNREVRKQYRRKMRHAAARREELRERRRVDRAGKRAEGKGGEAVVDA